MRDTTKIYIAAIILFIGTINSYSQLTPDWLNNVQIFQNTKGYIIDTSPILSKVNFTGQGWGVYFPNGWDQSILESEIGAWHSQNKIYISFGATISLYWPYSIPVPDSHRQLDLNGNFVDFLGCYRYTVCSEAWQDYVKSENRKAIDLGVEGIQFDDAQVPPLQMCPFESQPASFDSVTMVHFRNYLKQNFTPAQLQQRFDIANIDTFNYAEWIKQKGMESTWNNMPFTGLAAEFFKFMILATKEYFHNIAEDAKNYALNTYGRTITISCNPNFGAEGYHLAEDMDYFLAEHYPFQTDDPFAHTDIKGTKCIKNWPVYVIPEPRVEGLPLQTKNMIRLIVADIYGSGGRISFGEKLSDGIAHEVTPIEIDFDIFSDYVDFILSHRDLYENLTTAASVALLNSHSSRMARYWPVEGDAQVDYGWGFIGTGKLLTDSNIQFDCIFAPDNRFTNIPSFTIEDLQNYKVVILPHTFELTDSQAETLLNYVKAGGVIIAMGNIGTNNPDGTLANRPALQSLQQGDGIKSYGEGKFVYTWKNLGEFYLWDYGVPHAEVRNSFQSMILPHIKPKVITEGISETFRPGGATGFLYHDTHGNHIVHLVNYDYDEFNDFFSVKENFTLKILVDTSGAWQATYLSPDLPQPQILPTTKNGDYVCMTIPRLEAYGVVKLSEKTGVDKISNLIPEVFDIEQNYPNPFNSSTIIKFQVPKSSHVCIKIYDMLGREVKTLVEQKLQSGFYEAVWDGLDHRNITIPSGIYFYRMEADKFVKVRKVIVLR